MIDYYLELLRKLRALLPAGFEELKQEVDAVRQVLEAIVVPLTPCHNDPWPENFVEVRRRTYLIDWEYSGMNDPMWDLGNLSVEAGLRGEQDRVMMEAYCRGFVPSQLYDRVVLYKATGVVSSGLFGASFSTRTTTQQLLSGLTRSTGLSAAGHLCVVLIASISDHWKIAPIHRAAEKGYSRKPVL